MPYRGHVEQGIVVFDEAVSLPEGQSVTVEPTAGNGGGRGKNLLRLSNVFPQEDLREIETALRDCRSVDPDGW